MSWSNLTKPTQTIEYLATEALDFLITQDGKKLITNQSTIWKTIVKTISSWTNILK